MRVSEVFNKLLNAHVVANNVLWHQELQAILKFFPHISQQSLPNEGLKQRYDRLYPHIYKEQTMAYEFLLGNKSDPHFAKAQGIFQDMENKHERFKFSSLPRRKAYLTRWNIRLVNEQLGELQKEEVSFYGLTEVPEFIVTKLIANKNLKKLTFSNCRFRYLPDSFISLAKGLEFRFEACGDRLDPPKSFDSKVPIAWHWLDRLENKMIVEAETSKG